MAPFLPQVGLPATVLEEVELTGMTQAIAQARGFRAKTRHRLTRWKRDWYWRRALRRFDAITVVSEAEADAVRDLLRMNGAVGKTSAVAPRVVVVPNGVDVGAYRRGASGLSPISGRMIYNGALGYGPNQDAVRWFAREVLPRVVEQVPDAHLVVTGRCDHLGSEIDDLRNDPRVRLTGFVPDLRPVLDAASLCVVPLRQGGGTRLKVLEAFAAGVPVLSTTQGAAGIGAEHERDLLVADSADALARAAVRLLRNPDQAASLARAARRLVEARYDWVSIAASLSLLLESVVAAAEAGGSAAAAAENRFSISPQRKERSG
jgi:glycosyltransferase involved in cell wall biosynthesis